MSSPVTVWRRFLARPNDDRAKVFGVAFLTALFSAVLVTVASVTLSPLQEAHLEAERALRFEQMLDTLPGMREIMAEAGVDRLETRVVELETGAFIEGVDPADPDQAAVPIPTDKDIAGLGSRAALVPVHLLERDGEVLLIVLPVQGKGYQSTIKASLALEADLNSIAALTITEQGETPGLGARIEEPGWQGLWPGKEVADAEGRIVIDVVRGAEGAHEVDAISGATVTSNGVANMLRYWLGDHGFGPLIDRLRREGV